jgi:F0F1-type ATP synthase membrane subunit b/b'
MMSLDGSLIAAILIFLAVVVVLNRTLFQPLLRVQAEREHRTTGTVAQANKNLERHKELFGRYEASLKNARLEGYRFQETTRSEAMKKRGEMLGEARKEAERMVQGSRQTMQQQVQAAKAQLAQEAQEMAGSIAAAVLRRSV